MTVTQSHTAMVKKHSEVCCQTRKTSLTSTTTCTGGTRKVLPKLIHTAGCLFSSHVVKLNNRLCTCRRQRSSDTVRSCLERASSSSSSFQPSPSPGGKTSRAALISAGTILFQAGRRLQTTTAQMKIKRRRLQT